MPGTRSHSNFFRFHAVFGGKIGRIIAFHAHLWSWRRPPENPGSATATCQFYISLFCVSHHHFYECSHSNIPPSPPLSWHHNVSDNSYVTISWRKFLNVTLLSGSHNRGFHKRRKISILTLILTLYSNILSIFIFIYTIWCYLMLNLKIICLRELHYMAGYFISIVHFDWHSKFKVGNSGVPVPWRVCENL